jgi:four helix bundle protein
MRNDEGRPWDLLERTKEFALRIVRLYGALPKTTKAQVLGRQVLRSGTSVGAQLREGKRSRSDAEMISKTESALQELEETAYWLELLAESGMVDGEKLTGLRNEADQLTAILVTSAKSLKARGPRRQSSR